MTEVNGSFLFMIAKMSSYPRVEISSFEIEMETVVPRKVMCEPQSHSVTDILRKKPKVLRDESVGLL
jgi:hypothetical protein